MSEDDISRLREENAYLRSCLGLADSMPRVWRLSPLEERLVACLNKRGFAAKETILAACYGAHGIDEPEGDAVRVLVNKARHKLKAVGFENAITNHWGRGYELVPAVRGAISQMSAA